MMSEFWMRHRVEFAMTDMAGIMHFSNYFRMMEVTECAFFRALGFSITTHDGERKISFPRVHVACDYKAPLRFEEEVQIQLLVKEKRSKSLTYEFCFWKQGGETPILVAKGTTTAVCVSIEEASGKMKAVNIPPSIASQIEVAIPSTPSS